MRFILNERNLDSSLLLKAEKKIVPGILWSQEEPHMAITVCLFDFRYMSRIQGLLHKMR